MSPRLKALSLVTVFPILAGNILGTSSVLAYWPKLQSKSTSAVLLDREKGLIPILRQPQNTDVIHIPTAELLQQQLEELQQTLTIQREQGDRVGEAETLNKMGDIYTRLKSYSRALELHQQALEIFKKLGDRRNVAETIGYIGNNYFKLGEYQKIEEVFRQELDKLRKIGDRNGEQLLLEVMTRYVKGEWYMNPAWWTPPPNLSWQEILEITEINLFVNRETNDRQVESYSIHGMGWAYHNLGHYPKALEFYQQALTIAKELDDYLHESFILIDIGVFYIDLGQYDLALDYLDRAKRITETKELPEKTAEVEVLSKMGLVYKNIGKYELALQILQQSLSIQKSIVNQSISHQRPEILNTIGLVYFQMGDHEKALEAYQEALKYPSWNPGVKIFAINNIGMVYGKLGDYSKALEAYRQALAQFRKYNDLPGQRTVLKNIGILLEEQDREEIAIVFYKESVNITEEIRRNLQTLTRDEQQAYTETVADTYRRLADLLLDRERILEAQRVLELLKLKELQNFTRESRASGEKTEIELNPVEEEILKQHGTLIAFGQKVAECEETSCSELDTLLDQQTAIAQQFNQTVAQLEAEVRARRSQDTAFLDPEDLGRKAQEIVEAEPGTVLIYPFVLEDKIWLLWAARGGIVKTVEVPVTQKELAETVLEFRQLLQRPTSSLKKLQATSKKLYDWLIKPIAPELEANQIKNLVFSLDRATRYIPMSALYDGEKYLIENYTVSTILSADLTDTRDRLPPGKNNISVLAMGLSNAVGGFNALPNVPDELDGVVRSDNNDPKGVYAGREYLNEAFDFRALRNNLRGQQILHIATHGDFKPGRPEESYLVLGTGDKLAIPEISTLRSLSDVNLVVLSACETALGGEGTDGVEINGISYYFLNQGAKTVMASLWLVNDASTAQLMQDFYSNLARETPITKAEALRQAQLKMLRGEVSREGGSDRGLVEVRPVAEYETEGSASEFAHPYYWAAFILIGNGF